jgi:hypothetical protein
MVIADDDNGANTAVVTSINPDYSDDALCVRQIGWQGSIITPLNDVTVTSSATLVRTQQFARVALNITNNDGAVAVRWGNSGVTATKGQRIGPGQSISIASTDEVWMISEGADVTISATEETIS